MNRLNVTCDILRLNLYERRTEDRYRVAQTACDDRQARQDSLRAHFRQTFAEIAARWNDDGMRPGIDLEKFGPRQLPMNANYLVEPFIVDHAP
jgi:hypothetical protein